MRDGRIVTEPIEITFDRRPFRSVASLGLGLKIGIAVNAGGPVSLVEAVKLSGNDEAESMLGILLDGKRLRDIADLPLDLAV